MSDTARTDLFGIRVEGRRRDASSKARTSDQPDGFFKTKFVSANSQAEAEEKALALVRAEIEKRRPDWSWDLVVDAVWEGPERAAAEGPGAGFVFFGGRGEATWARTAGTIIRVCGLIGMGLVTLWLMIQSYGSFWAADGASDPGRAHHESIGHLLTVAASVSAVGSLLLLLSLLRRRQKKLERSYIL